MEGSNSSYVKLEDLTAYQLACQVADEVWDITVKWDWFAKQTIGRQFVNSADSGAANIAEGYGRYHKKDKIKFYLNARASIYEAKHWCQTAKKRKLLTEEEYSNIFTKLEKLPKEINILIKLTNNLKE